ncbi:anthranilate synthase component II [Patescibacteria group bacterium]
MKKILVVDNFDSFTYNLVQQIKSLIQCNVIVVRNDDMSKISRDKFDILIISPGPKTPKDAGISIKLIRDFYKTKPILGVCLGMQCINEVFGGKTVHSPLPYHGKISKIKHNATHIFKDMPQKFAAARYHSLIIDNISPQLEIIAQTDDGIPMAIKHKKYPVYGVQFHPESFMTQRGNQIMTNFLNESA